ncbi:MAG TPA: beta-propeller domain-containing protein [Pyrinomonadaceae bacterium]|nr:beta-propeller domain-containing protein [Pyrinomonadaceae bacterium]
MKTIVPTLFAAVIVVCLSALTTVTTGTIPPVTPPAAARKMQAFKSEQELKRYFRRLAAKSRPMNVAKPAEVAGVAASPVAKAAEPAPLARARSSEDSESITNTQHVGVDEGDIVKLHGDHLVILRRGRLFTVAINESMLRPVSAIDAFGPDIDPDETWYDEMLVSRDTIAIIGYSYQREGTEVGLFNIDAQGKLGYRATYHLRSNDYYSSRNYASRLIGEKLIFYAPLYMYPGENELLESLPAVRKWHKGATDKEFKRIAPAQRIYRPEYSLDIADGLALHTVTVCDLSKGGFDCQATSAIGPEGNVFYVSPDSVYVWATSWTYRDDEDKSKSILFRMPLDGSGPSALRVAGSPVDQFSFLQSDDYYLNVLVRSEGNGDGMWAAEVAEGDVALLRVPLNSFSDGSLWAPRSSYRRLPKPEGDTFQNRFIGNYLLYGTGSGWFDSEKNKAVSELYVIEWAKRGSHRLQLPHGVDRIEQMGDDAVVVGTDGKDLHFSAIRLGGRPEIASRYTRREASQGELRSHGFFYKPESETSGLLGLPIGLPGRPGSEHLFESSAAILFLRNDGLQFQEIGELAAQADKAVDDRCRASCVDWYGNARPLFLRGRMFALLGYELVEGSVMQGRIREVSRINYAP